MIKFTTKLLKFDQQGEKTGWTYLLIPKKIAVKIKADTKKSFRVKGSIDEHVIKAISILPMGGGDFIMPVNAVMRKSTRKKKGDTVEVSLEEDASEIPLSAVLLECLADEPIANEFFTSLPMSHRQYYSKWIESAKTDATKTKRIARCLHAFGNKLSYSQMMRLYKNE